MVLLVVTDGLHAAKSSKRSSASSQPVRTFAHSSLSLTNFLYLVPGMPLSRLPSYHSALLLSLLRCFLCIYLTLQCWRATGPSLTSFSLHRHLGDLTSLMASTPSGCDDGPLFVPLTQAFFQNSRRIYPAAHLTSPLKGIPKLAW